MADASMIHVHCIGTLNLLGKLGVWMMPRNAVKVPPHWPDDDDVDTDGAIMVPPAESVGGINANDEGDDDDDIDDDDEYNNIFSARPATTKAKT